MKPGRFIRIGGGALAGTGSALIGGGGVAIAWGGGWWAGSKIYDRYERQISSTIDKVCRADPDDCLKKFEDDTAWCVSKWPRNTRKKYGMS